MDTEKKERCRGCEVASGLICICSGSFFIIAFLALSFDIAIAMTIFAFIMELIFPILVIAIGVSVVVVGIASLFDGLFKK